jgi:stage V sporulation protein SpoVS
MNDKSVIFFQCGNPVLDVSSGVAVGALVRNPGDGAKKGCAHLCDQFLFAVKLISEAVAKDAMQTALVAGAVYQFVKEPAVIVRRIDEAGTCGHVNGIGRGAVVSAVLGGAIEVERGAILPSGDNALAEFVFADLRRDGRLRDFRKREAVALLHVENRVMAKNEGNALILARCFLVFRGAFGKLLLKDNRRTVLAFADAAFQCLGLLEGKPERRTVRTRPKQ